MSRLPLPLTEIIHENLSIIATFAFSRRPLERLMDERFKGEWKYLGKALFTISEKRVAKACLELALFMRALDDRENITKYRMNASPLGRLIKTGEPDTGLTFRDVANKIIHAEDLQWDFSKADEPVLICVGSQTEKWIRAEVEIVALAASLGMLMS